MSNGVGRMLLSAKDGLVYSGGLNGRKITRVFIDVDTQRDFMYPTGVAYFRQAAQIAPRLARLFSCARSRGYPVISTTMCLRSNGNGHVPCQDNGCVEGTNGQKKPAFALLGRRTYFGPNGNTDLPPGLLRRFQQAIFAKRTPNPFEHPKLDRLLTGMMVSEFVVFGLATEEAVKHTVLGLLARGKQVKLVIDATAGRDGHQADMALKLMLAKGARVITTRQLAPDMQPRPDLDVLLKRLTVTDVQTSDLSISGPARTSLKLGGNGNGNNGKKTRVRGHNGKGNGKGKLAKVHGGNGNGNGRSKSAPAKPPIPDVYRLHVAK